MSIKKVFIICLIISLLIPAITHAQIKISEIMYDPLGSDTKREWIEVFNESNQDVDLSTWFFYEGNVFHKLVAQTQSILPAGSYAIIVDSIVEVLADHSDFSGVIFDSVFSLNNTGESISIADSQKMVINTVTYSADMGASNDGNSLQINDKTIITADQTFGIINKTENELPIIDDSPSTASTTPLNSTSPTNDSTHSEQVTVSNYIPSSLFKIGAGRDRTVSINTEIDFEAYLSKTEIKPRFHWNFGDFDEDRGQKVKHIYNNEGVYEVVLEGRGNGYTGISRTQVHAIRPQLSIVHSTSTIIIYNNSKQEINLGDFRFNFEEGKKVIPRNTILAGTVSISMSVATSTILRSFEYPNGQIYMSFDTI